MTLEQFFVAFFLGFVSAILTSRSHTIGGVGAHFFLRRLGWRFHKVRVVTVLHMNRRSIRIGRDIDGLKVGDSVAVYYEETEPTPPAPHNDRELFDGVG